MRAIDDLGMVPDKPEASTENGRRLLLAPDAVDLGKRSFHVGGKHHSTRSHRILNGGLVLTGDVLSLKESKPERVLELDDVDVGGQGALWRGIDPLLLSKHIRIHGCTFRGRVAAFAASLSPTTDPERVRTGFMDEISVLGGRSEGVIGSVFSMTNGEWTRFRIKGHRIENCAGVWLQSNIFHKADVDPMPNWIRYRFRPDVEILDNFVTGGPLTLNWPEDFNLYGGVYQVAFLFKAYNIRVKGNTYKGVRHAGTYENSAKERRRRSTYADYLHSTYYECLDNLVEDVGHVEEGTVWGHAKGTGPDAWDKGARIIQGNTFRQITIPSGSILGYYEPVSRIEITRNYFGAKQITILNTPLRIRDLYRTSGNTVKGELAGVARISAHTQRSTLTVETDGVIPFEITRPWDGLKQAAEPGYPPTVIKVSGSVPVPTPEPAPAPQPPERPQPVPPTPEPAPLVPEPTPPASPAPEMVPEQGKKPSGALAAIGLALLMLFTVLIFIM